MNSNKIAVFDFCDTLYNGQSLNDFLIYFSKNSFIKKVYLSSINHLYKLGLLRSDIKKSLQLKIFNGINQNKIDSICFNFYQDIIKKNLNISVTNELNRLNQDGYQILILSGALSDYLKYLKFDFPISKIISNSLQFDGEMCLGVIDKPECLGIGKLEKFQQNFNLINENIIDSIFFTDHASDSILFSFFKQNIIVVKKNNIPNWVKHINFNIIEVE